MCFYLIMLGGHISSYQPTMKEVKTYLLVWGARFCCKTSCKKLHVLLPRKLIWARKMDCYLQMRVNFKTQHFNFFSYYDWNNFPKSSLLIHVRNTVKSNSLGHEPGKRDAGVSKLTMEIQSQNLNGIGNGLVCFLLL